MILMMIERANASMIETVLTLNVHSSRSIPIPEGPHLFSDPATLGLLFLLVAYYFMVWLLFGRDPKVGTVHVEYGPPQGMSPAEARFAIIGGTDRKTIAAVLAHLAS